MPEQNKKLAGFEALYQVEQQKRGQKDAATESESAKPSPKEAASETKLPMQKRRRSEDDIVSNKVSKLESNTTIRPAVEYFEPTTFKADRRKVRALKKLALDIEPTRKLQDLFDEALSDILAKYGREIE